MCLENYIGIRGECDDSAVKMFIDDLPGVNIVNVSDVVEGVDIKPIDLVNKSFNLAIDQIYNDWVNSMQSVFEYRAILSDVEYEYAGTDSYYGNVAEDIEIVIERGVDYYKFIETSVYHLGIISDSEITGKEFDIYDQYGLKTETITVNIIIGYNSIPISLNTTTNKITIKFSLSDLKVGRGEIAYIGNRECEPCQQRGCNDCLIVTISNPSIGFDLKTKCIASKCEIIEYFMENLKVPLLYKTGINYLIEVKSTSRVNSYTRNSQDKINELLNMWQGGTDVVTGIKTNSAYWQALKSATNSTINTLKHMRLKIFHYSGTQICNNLP